MVPQVLQLNEMQPCWEERFPHCPRYPPIHTHAHTHTEIWPLLIHAVPAPTLLMFIHQPLKGQMQKPVKTKTDLFFKWYKALISEAEEARPHAKPDSEILKSSPFFGEELTTNVTSKRETKKCTGLTGRWEARPLREGEVEKLVEARGHEKGEDWTEN